MTKIDFDNYKKSILDKMYINYDLDKHPHHRQKRMMHNNIARTKAIDNFCKFIIKCTERKVAKINPESTVQHLKNVCKERLDLNKKIRDETFEKIHAINEKLKKQESDDINDYRL